MRKKRSLLIGLLAVGFLLTGSVSTFAEPEYRITAKNTQTSIRKDLRMRMGRILSSDGASAWKDRNEFVMINTGVLSAGEVEALAGDLSVFYEMEGKSFLESTGQMASYRQALRLSGRTGSLTGDASMDPSNSVGRDYNVQPDDGSLLGRAKEYPTTVEDYGTAKELVTVFSTLASKQGVPSNVLSLAREERLSGQTGSYTAGGKVALPYTDTAYATGVKRYTGLRKDIFAYGVSDTDYWTDRFVPLLNQYESRGGATDIEVMAVIDYHVLSTKLSVKEDVSYSGNERGESLWRLYNGSKFLQEAWGTSAQVLDTGSLEEGSYTVKCYQYATYKEEQSADVEVYEYLVDRATGTVLYFYKYDSRVKLAETVQSDPVLTETGQGFVLRVRNLNEIYKKEDKDQNRFQMVERVG